MVAGLVKARRRHIPLPIASFGIAVLVATAFMDDENTDPGTSLIDVSFPSPLRNDECAGSRHRQEKQEKGAVRLGQSSVRWTPLVYVQDTAGCMHAANPTRASTRQRRLNGSAIPVVVSIRRGVRIHSSTWARPVLRSSYQLDVRLSQWEPPRGQVEAGHKKVSALPQ